MQKSISRLYTISIFCETYPFVNPNYHKSWLARVAAGLLGVAFGMHWFVLHLATFGFFLLANIPGTPQDIVAIDGNHQDCLVCDSLSETEKESGDSMPSVSQQTYNIEGIETSSLLVLDPNAFFITNLSAPSDPAFNNCPFSLKKPPKVTA